MNDTRPAGTTERSYALVGGDHDEDGETLYVITEPANRVFGIHVRIVVGDDGVPSAEIAGITEGRIQ